MLMSVWCDYNDAYILSKGTITVPNTAATGAAAAYNNKKVIIKTELHLLIAQAKVLHKCLCCQADVVRPVADDDFEINNAQILM